jgi:hypothetical protein
LTVVIAACAACLTAAPAFADSPDLGWLAGHWRSETDRRVTEEIWTAPEGGIMLGVGRTIRDGRAVGFEFLYITTGADAAYFAQPGGRPPVRFALVAQDGESAVFENPDHDFPQRIEYARDGDILTAAISTMDREREIRWSWTRQD